ncbi:hypothetical protein AMS68_005076 [Peltaster fructicola]|uniref:Uncharacterized protein n=1 Tax=Peltaster fructicola TaxID=286661 RepID=A0A6H0XY59_9PEZI|nr:hypothetical protein AMS68_005076 [Peltaster fructicola]
MSIRLLRTDCTDELVFETFREQHLWNGEGGLDSSQDLDKDAIRFAILSHRWREDEVEWPDCKDITKARQKKGWAKLEAFLSLARKLFIKYVWLDTCCIDKSSSTELAESLNSMFKWYRLAYVCIAYLDDVHGDVRPTDVESQCSEQRSSLIDNLKTFEPRGAGSEARSPWDYLEPRSLNGSRHSSSTIAASDLRRFCSTQYIPGNQPILPQWFMDAAMVEDYWEYCTYGKSTTHDTRWSEVRKSEWFTRGWTLQEMIAPNTLAYFDAEWNLVGRREQLSELVEQITGVDAELLVHPYRLRNYSVAQKLSWAANRITTRLEDRAYSLLGLLEVNMTIIYGEGSQAFLRLQEEILRTKADTTIFAWQDSHDAWAVHPLWHPGRQLYSNLLARSPDAFKNCSRTIPIVNQRRSHHLVGSQVQFETKVFVPFDQKLGYDANARQAIIGCYKDDPLTLITLNLVPTVHSRGTYLVAGGQGRLKVENLFRAAETPDAGALSVWRTVDDARDGELEDAWDLVLCRCVGSRLEIVGGEPATLWQPDNQIFRLQPEFKGMLRLKVKGTTATYINLSLRLDPKDGFLVIGFPWWRTMSVPARPYWLQDLLSVRWCRDQVITARVHDLTLLDLETQVLEISVISIDAALLRVLRWCTLKAVHGLLLLVPNSPIILSIVMPVVTMYVIRRSQYNLPTSEENLIDTSEIITLCLGALVSIIIWNVVDIRSGNSFGDGVSLRPSEGVVNFFSQLPSVIPRVIKNEIVPMRSWYILATNVASIVLCSVYLGLQQTHTSDTSIHGLYSDDVVVRSLADPKGMYCAIIRIVCCAVITFLSWSNIDMLRIAMTVGVAAPLIQVGLAGMPLIVPWTDKACNRGQITAYAATFFAQYGSSTGRDEASVCRDFSYQGRMLWAIVVLALCEGLFALLTIPYTRGLHSPRELLLTVFDIFKLIRDLRSIHHR